MVRSLGTGLHLTEKHVGIAGGVLQHLFKQFPRHKMRTGTGREEAPVLYEPHAIRIDFPVSFGSAFYMVL